MARRRKPLPKDPVATTIDDLTHEGKGVAHVDGKTVFIDQALPGEEIKFTYINRRRQYDQGRLYSIDKPSAMRIEPGCPHFAICGGCSLQHIGQDDQIKLKQNILINNLQRIGHVTPALVKDPVTGPVWGYRHKARLGVKLVYKKNKVFVGFREKSSRLLADLSVCKVLHPSVGEKLEQIGTLVASLSCPTSIPQIEVAVGETTVALVFRHLQTLTDDDSQKLTEFSQEHGFDIYTQSGGPKTVQRLSPMQSELFYTIKDHDIRFDFLPGDFVQVNTAMNNKMVTKVLAALDLTKKHKVLELFCGLGNFTLPISRQVAGITAIEGEATLIERARENALKNKVSNVTYHIANLMVDTGMLPWWREKYDRLFLDPPRSGAYEILPDIIKTGIKRIVYVSCNPATLARDAGYLVNEGGYQLHEVGIVDMFPHTAHVESIAIFAKA